MKNASQNNVFARDFTVQNTLALYSTVSIKF